MTMERAEPREVALRQHPTDPDKLVLEAEYPHVDPQVLFRYCVEPALLARWWPPEAEVDGRMGGAYHFAWAGQNWHLRGHYLAFEPGEQLAFTWQWEHSPQVPTRNVFIDFDPMPGGGTRLTLTQSTYQYSPEDQADRQGHLEGWTYFLTRLGEVSGER